MLIRQIVAAFVAVLGSPLPILVPTLGIMTLALASGDGDANQMAETAGVVLAAPIVLSLIAGALCVLSLFWVKLQYGTIIFLALSALAFILTAVSITSIGPALAGIAASFIVAGLLSSGLFVMLRWFYAAPTTVSDPAEAF